MTSLPLPCKGSACNGGVKVGRWELEQPSQTKRRKLLAKESKGTQLRRSLTPHPHPPPRDDGATISALNCPPRLSREKVANFYFCLPVTLDLAVIAAESNLDRAKG